jgi:predicted RNase H-like nuclease/predicted enzyme related to lactoylglutathione lyase
MTEPRLAFVALRVRDLERSERFYRETIGVPLERGTGGEGAHYEYSWREGAYLHFALFEGEPTERAWLAFHVDDLEAAHARVLATGATVIDAPRDEPWGRTAAYSDPDGHTVGLTERRATRVAGVDMATGGWAVVLLEGNHVVDAFRCEVFADALALDAQVVGVDVPMGLPEREPRPADAAARRFVGARASSVFATPPRAVLEAPTYAQARAVATEVTGKSLSAQSYALARRILEVDDYARDDERIIEVHPEVSFRELATGPLDSKRSSHGLAQRRAALAEAGIEVPEHVPRLREPDLLDATVAAWTASRYARREAKPLPETHSERIGAIWR